MTRAALLLVLLLIAPTAAAFPWDPVEITLGQAHFGDVYRLDMTDGNDTASEITLIQGGGKLFDRFGIERDVETYRVDHVAANGTLTGSERCSAIAGGRDAVQYERLEGSGSDSGSFDSRVANVVLTQTKYDTTRLSQSFFGTFECSTTHPLAGRHFREGQVVEWDELQLGEHLDAVAHPARATRIHGRHALDLSYDVTLDDRTARFTLTLADGLPGPVLGVGEFTDANGTKTTFRSELVGYQAGTGPALAPWTNATLPDRDPQGDFVELGALEFPTEAFDVRYPLADALASLQNDPRVGLREWLAAHPDAILVGGSYERDAKTTGDQPSDGGWAVHFAEGSEGYAAGTVRPHIAASTLPVAIPISYQQWGMEFSPFSEAPARPTSVASSATLSRLAASRGLNEGDVKSISFYLYDNSGVPSFVAILSDQSSELASNDQHYVGVDLVDGGLVWDARARTTVTESGILAPLQAPPAVRDASASGFSTLSSPTPGVGLGIGAAGAGALFLILKFLAIPFYTRLVRTRLLDNPVRARIYERIRAEPGIHLAELEDFAAIGRGATKHHVDQLVKHRYAVEMEDGGFTRYFAAGEVPPAVARRAAVLRAGSNAKVYDVLAREPGLSLREVGRRVGISAPAVLKAKRKLEAAGLLPAAAEADVREKPTA